jgi:CheY-like chemotaxis protein
VTETLPILLLVEDDPADARLILRALERVEIPAQLVHVKDGDAAVEYLAAETANVSNEPVAATQLVILDLKLPRRSGLEVLQWIRKQESNISRVPVIMLSSSHHGVDIERAYQYGVNSYLVKPETSDQLLSMMTLLKNYWFYNNKTQLLPVVR